MSTNTLCDLRLHIYNFIIHACGQLDERIIQIIAGNITFLIKYTFGPGVEPAKISIPIIDIREGHVLKAKQATVLMHREAGKFDIIVKTEVRCRQACDAHIISVLTEKVDAMIKEILVI